MSESVQAINPFGEAPAAWSGAQLRPTTREWIRHSILFLLTVVTTTLAGITIVGPLPDVPEPPLNRLIDYFLYLPHAYLNSVISLLWSAITQPTLLVDGVIFSTSLLAILAAHEMGHYVACRRYGVNATLPFFIPAPPLILAGTFGAFIKIKSPIPSRHALFDIGLAGPLAGFVVAIPVAVLGILSLQPGVPFSGHGIVFHDPLLFRLIAKAMGISLDPYATNPYYMAAWIGLLVTSLNLMPVGQLDGGHGTFAVFGQRAHKFIGRVAFVVMAFLALMGFFWYSSPSGLLYTILLAVMLKVRHPQPEVTEDLGKGRVLIAIVTLIVFALCFWPFPITII